MTLYQCEECDWEGQDDEMAPIDDVEERVAPGELMAAGCCPECGALIGVDDADVPYYTLKACAKIMLERGWKITEPTP